MIDSFLSWSSDYNDDDDDDDDAAAAEDNLLCFEKKKKCDRYDLLMLELTYTTTNN